MSTRDQIQKEVDHWMTVLDKGNLEDLMECLHPEVLCANEKKPTFIGIPKMREKYFGVIENYETDSEFDLEHFTEFGDTAFVIGEFRTTLTDRKTKESRKTSGRLTLAYVKNENDEWKIVLDIDNN